MIAGYRGNAIPLNNAAQHQPQPRVAQIIRDGGQINNFLDNLLRRRPGQRIEDG